MFETSLSAAPRCPRCHAEHAAALKAPALYLLAGVAAASLALAGLGFAWLSGAMLVAGGIAAGIVNGRSMKWRCDSCGERWR